MRLSFPFLACFLGAILVAFFLWPQADIAISGLFAFGSRGFYLASNPLLTGLKDMAFYGARFMAGLFLIGSVVSFIRHRPFLCLSSKAWLFLLLSLLIGPGLLANVVFKDQWGRARPRTIEAFGGDSHFTPVFVMSDQCQRNCSFVSGDAAFGFFLPSLAYVVPIRRRRVFWGGLGIGSLFAMARILVGAHFTSDVLAALVLVSAVSAFLHAIMFGRKKTAQCWDEWLRLSP